MCVSTQHLGGHDFYILDFLILLLVYSEVLRITRSNLKLLLFLMHSQVPIGIMNNLFIVSVCDRKSRRIAV